jgi:hypothetical protein
MCMCWHTSATRIPCIGLTIYNSDSGCRNRPFTEIYKRPGELHVFSAAASPRTPRPAGAPKGAKLYAEVINKAVLPEAMTGSGKEVSSRPWVTAGAACGRFSAGP